MSRHLPGKILAHGLDMTIIAGDVFSAFKAAAVDEEVARWTAAKVADIKKVDPANEDRLGRTEAALASMRCSSPRPRRVRSPPLCSLPFTKPLFPRSA